METSTHTTQRLWTLDVLRSIAIIAILMVHLYPRSENPALAGVNAFVESLWCGVDLFFVLSGFLITGVLLRARGTRKAYSTFSIKRIARIFPLYYFWLTAFYLVGILFPHPHYKILNVVAPYVYTYTFNFAVLKAGDLPPITDLSPLWSLSVEEQFYLFWPLVVLFCKPRWQIVTAVSLISLAIGLKMYCLYHRVPPMIPYTFLFTRMDSLLCGALAAYAVEWGQRRDVFTNTAVAAVVISSCAITYYAGSVGHVQATGLSVTVATIIFAFLFSGALYLLVHWEKRRQETSASFAIPVMLRVPIEYIASISYGLYVSHHILRCGLERYWGGFTELTQVQRSLLVLLASFAISSILYYILELPCQRLGKRFLLWRADQLSRKELKVIVGAEPPEHLTR